ncbi:MAG: hypothetical protein AAB791_02440 [Patescibacteria group bacterium]|mgnify:CR=1 FL=1
MKKKLPKINLYRNISISFVVLTLVLLAAVFMFFTNKAAIIVMPKAQEVNLSFNAEVKASPTDEEISKDVIAGQLATKERSGEGEYEVLSTKTETSEIVGKVKIVNSSARNQPLVKTTQLQASSGVIVRLNKTVSVAAGSSEVVEVYPADPAAFKEIDPGKLVIIKLNPSLQDKIYGVAEGKLTQEPREVKILSESDISRAQEALSQQIVEAYRQENNLSKEEKLSTETISSEADAKIGAETDNFKLKMTVEIKRLDLDESQLANLINKKIAGLDLTGVTISQVSVKDSDIVVVEDDLSGSVLIKVNYVLKTKMDETNGLLAKKNFIGKTINEAKEYLMSSGFVDDAKVIVSPYWRKTLPKDAGKIKIIVQ